MGGLFGGGSPSIPAAPPPPPRREDPSIVEARQKARLARGRRRGRRATLLTSSEGVLGDPVLNQPAARNGARLLGQP